jgi:hypothetical protein
VTVTVSPPDRRRRRLREENQELDSVNYLSQDLFRVGQGPSRYAGVMIAGPGPLAGLAGACVTLARRPPGPGTHPGTKSLSWPGSLRACLRLRLQESLDPGGGKCQALDPGWYWKCINDLFPASAGSGAGL